MLSNSSFESFTIERSDVPLIPPSSTLLSINIFEETAVQRSNNENLVLESTIFDQSPDKPFTTEISSITAFVAEISLILASIADNFSVIVSVAEISLILASIAEIFWTEIFSKYFSYRC